MEKNHWSNPDEPFWKRMEPIGVHDELPDGYEKLNSVYDIIDVTPRLTSLYRLKKGTIAIETNGKYVEYNIDHNLRENDITDKTYIKLV